MATKAAKQIVVYRHGSNAANQSLRNVIPVFICVASDGDEAERMALAEGVTCYNNQYLSWKYASRCKVADRKEAVERTEILCADAE